MVDYCPHFGLASHKVMVQDFKFRLEIGVCCRKSWNNFTKSRFLGGFAFLIRTEGIMLRIWEILSIKIGKVGKYVFFFFIVLYVFFSCFKCFLMFSFFVFYVLYFFLMFSMLSQAKCVSVRCVTEPDILHLFYGKPHVIFFITRSLTMNDIVKHLSGGNLLICLVDWSLLECIWCDRVVRKLQPFF